MTELYNPKTVFTHAALLRQAFAHCGRFPTAASRRSLGRVSVPVWPIALSGRLRIVALVGRYPANQLMRRGPLDKRRQSAFPSPPRRKGNLCGISTRFQALSPTRRQVAHVFLTRPPLAARRPPARLACIRHAASVRPEPGSNSQHQSRRPCPGFVDRSRRAGVFALLHTRLVFKDPRRVLRGGVD